MTEGRTENGRLQEDLAKERERRSAAEEKSTRVDEMDAANKELEKVRNGLGIENTELKTENAKLKTTLEKEKESAEEKLQLLHEAEKKFSDAFKALSSEALQVNRESFLALAEEKFGKYQAAAKGDLEKRQQAIDQLVKPISESLTSIKKDIQATEKSRIEAYASLNEQIVGMSKAQALLGTETGKLVTALRNPTTRGLWGEMQLKNAVETAGMLEYVDFREQESIPTADGLRRPDMIINMPNGGIVVVDSKVALSSYLESIDAPDEATRESKLKDHARQVHDHVKGLSSKAYWAQFDRSPEFVVMFLPGEVFYSAALQQQPDLIQVGAEAKVLIAPPTFLIGLLRVVAFGWREERLAQSAQEVSRLGMELYERLRVLASHFGSLKKGLDTATDSYNKAVSTLESRIFVSARRFKELGAARGEDIPELGFIDTIPRVLDSAEFNEPSEEDVEKPSEPQRAEDAS